MMEKGIDKIAFTEWADPAYFEKQPKTHNIGKLIKNIFIPIEGHTIIPTPTGIVLIVLCLSIGSAAYNTSSNILFMTLSLLLSCLLLSGVLSWLNFRETRWRIITEPHFRAGEPAAVQIELTNDKKLVPTYSIWFNVHAVIADKQERVYLKQRLDPKATTLLEWIFEPTKRGIENIEISGLETQFPLGFLRKVIGGGIQREVPVWPKRIPYDIAPRYGHLSHYTGETIQKPGSGFEIINLREYHRGDSQRKVHWKATARMRKLMVRQTMEDTQINYLLFIETPAALWGNEEQFETLCSFAATLAEDLYMQNRLWGVAINDQPTCLVKRLNHLHSFIDQLARLETVEPTAPSKLETEATTITFKPASGNSVNAFIAGNSIGSA